MERLLEEVSFEAADRDGVPRSPSMPQYVDASLGELVKDEDLTRYIL